MFLLFFLVTRNNDLFIPVPIVNIKVKEEPAIPTGKPNTAAYEAILNVLNDADKAINIDLNNQNYLNIFFSFFNFIVKMLFYFIYFI